VQHVLVTSSSPREGKSFTSRQIGAGGSATGGQSRPAVRSRYCGGDPASIFQIDRTRESGRLPAGQAELTEVDSIERAPASLVVDRGPGGPVVNPAWDCCILEQARRL